MSLSVFSSIPVNVEVPLSTLTAGLFIILFTIYVREKRIREEYAQKTSGDEKLTASVATGGPIPSRTEIVKYKSDDPKPTASEPIASFRRNSNSLPYRMEEEGSRKSSSEYTRRGQLWSKHASWNLPKAPRLSSATSERGSRWTQQGLEHVFAILNKFDVDPRRGFLPSQDPLQRLPYARYHLWEDLADDLPKLLGARLGQARGPLRQLPVLLTDKLITDAELRRAHLLLCLFAHAYIWGGPEPLDEIPEGIAVPLWEVSKRLGMPPVLGHPSIVLYNWRRLDAEADICMENLSTLNNFFDGRDESWFYLITVELEQRGAAAVVPMMLLTDAIQRYHEDEKHSTRRTESESSDDLVSTPDPIDLHSEDDSVRDEHKSDSSSDYDFDDLDSESSRDEEALVGELTEHRVAVYVSTQLKKVAVAIQGMCASMGAMREGCHPFIFYHRVRPFLSAWKQNPTLPNGVIYQGVSLERQQFYGGSAAQSSLLPFLDIGLGVSHESTKSLDFLLAMRDYMPRQHRKFLEYLETVACVRQFIVDSLMSHGITSEMVSEQKLVGDVRQPHRSHLGAASSNCAKRMAPLTDAELKDAAEKKVWMDLRDAYDSCIDGLQAFRTSHMSIVAEYIIAQQKKGVNKDNLEGSAGGKGTGGTDLMKFLKPIRDNCGESLLTSPVPKPPAADLAEEPYKKDNGCSEDIDLYRGVANPAGKIISKPTSPTDRGWDAVSNGPAVFTLSRQ